MGIFWAHTGTIGCIELSLVDNALRCILTSFYMQCYTQIILDLKATAFSQWINFCELVYIRENTNCEKLSATGLRTTHAMYSRKLEPQMPRLPSSGCGLVPDFPCVGVAASPGFPRLGVASSQTSLVWVWPCPRLPSSGCGLVPDFPCVGAC